MKSFLKYLLATVVGILLSSIVLFFIIMGIIGVIVSSADKPVDVKPNTILHIKLNETISDRSSGNPFEGFDYSNFRPTKQLGLDDILKNIRKAKHDDNIKGILLDFTYIPSGISTIDEIRQALADFKESGKFIISFADSYFQNTYYLATVADSIYLNPAGNLTFIGLRSESLFFKGMFEKLGVEPQIIRHGEFKSAIEPLVEDRMSAENREQRMVYTNAIWGYLLQGISESRNISVDELNKLADNISIRTAKDAYKHHLVDGLRYKDEIIDQLKKLTDRKDNQKLQVVSLSNYTNVPEKRQFKGLARDKIAIVYAMGDIIMGEGNEGNTGSDRISRAIREARQDSTIKAIVIRVNSGGGSALASEVIWRETKLASETKPVIASMGDLAASGGYYILAAADTIVANPTTITGSIGVFGVLFNAQSFMNNKLGITTDVVKTNKHADFGSMFRPLSSWERDVIQHAVEDVYETFISNVAEGRILKMEYVDEVGEGRVWSGIDAKRLGLIDVYGGLDKAIEIAAAKADIEHYRVVSLPKLEDPLQMFLKGMTGNIRASIIKKDLGENYVYLKYLESLMNMEGIQARLPYFINVY